jgi:hypothetical protein
VFPSATAEQLTAIAKALFYKERTYQTMLDNAASRVDEPELARFAAWLPAGRVDRKRQDALEMIAAITALITAGAPPLRVDYALAETAAWRAAKRLSLSVPVSERF